MTFRLLKILVPAILGGALTNAVAEGKVDFRNCGILFATQADRWVYDLDGRGLFGSQWCVQLYYRPGADRPVDGQGNLINATEVHGDPPPFRVPTFRGWWFVPNGTSPYRLALMRDPTGIRLHPILPCPDQTIGLRVPFATENG